MEHPSPVMDNVVHALRQRFRRRSASRNAQVTPHYNAEFDASRTHAYAEVETEAFTPDLMPPISSASQTPTPLPTPSSVWRRSRSRRSLKALKKKLFGQGEQRQDESGDREITSAVERQEEEESLAWTAPSSPNIGMGNTPRRRNSARLRELQRILQAYHAQRDAWQSPTASPAPIRRQQEDAPRHPEDPLLMQPYRNPPRPSSPEGTGQVWSTASYRNGYRSASVGHPSVRTLSYARGELGPERPLVLEKQNTIAYPSGSGYGRAPPPVVTVRKPTLSQLELALRNGASPTCPSTMVISTSGDSASPPPPEPHQRSAQQIPHHVTLISPSPHEQLSAYMPPPIRLQQHIIIEHEGTLDMVRNVKKAKKSKNEEKRKKRDAPTDVRTETQMAVEWSSTSGVQQSSKAIPGHQQVLHSVKSTTAAGLMGIQQLLQRHRAQPRQEDTKNSPLLKSAKSEPRLASARSREREHWLLMSRPERPGSRFLSPTPSAGALEHLDRLRERITETKYVTAVFESRGGLGPVLSDVQAELEHWLGTRSALLAVACEVHWSVPERFRSRQLEIQLKDCLHAVLRENNRRVLSLSDDAADDAVIVEEAPPPPRASTTRRNRSHSAQSLNRPWRAAPFPIVLARSKTEESCVRDAELDTFQGIYRRFYPSLLALQDPATVKAHKSLTDVHESPLVPDPARFLYQPDQPGLLARKSLVALNMAVLRMRGDERNYDAEEGRASRAEPGLKESDL